MTVDEIDIRILELLQKDGRISNQDLADGVGLSPSPCLRRVRALEAEGVIERYVAILRAESVGLGLAVFVEVKLERQASGLSERFEAAMLKSPEVLECSVVAGEWDYLLRVVVRDLNEFRDFCMNKLAKMPGVSNLKSNIVMKQVKYSTGLRVR